jgi:hypothetical protein
VHKAQITFDALDTETGELHRARIASKPEAVRDWVKRFDDSEVEVAVEAGPIGAERSVRFARTARSGSSSASNEKPMNRMEWRQPMRQPRSRSDAGMTRDGLSIGQAS